jgi:hypothetical protein
LVIEVARDLMISRTSAGSHKHDNHQASLFGDVTQIGRRASVLVYLKIYQNFKQEILFVWLKRGYELAMQEQISTATPLVYRVLAYRRSQNILFTIKPNLIEKMYYSISTTRHHFSGYELTP